MSTITNANLNDQYQDLQNRLFKALLEKEIYQERLAATETEIKALRNVVAGIDLARAKPEGESP